MKTIFILLLLFSNLIIHAQNDKIKWTNEELISAKTADTISTLTTIEKDAIMYINLARMYPKKFGQIELPGYFGTKKYGDYIKGSPYITSLAQHLDTLTPMQPVTPIDSMSANAKCFAIEMGDAGYTGHNRINCKKEKYYAEACSYGMDNGKDIVMQMLIDHNIESLGHRKICLDASYHYIGIATHTHKEWDDCCVIEFKRK